MELLLDPTSHPYAQPPSPRTLLDGHRLPSPSPLRSWLRSPIPIFHLSSTQSAPPYSSSCGAWADLAQARAQTDLACEPRSEAAAATLCRLLTAAATLCRQHKLIKGRHGSPEGGDVGPCMTDIRGGVWYEGTVPSRREKILAIEHPCCGDPSPRAAVGA
mmetsp:Transcript_52385/g.117688  ORF Transcript_52385/g.117688 Transcript_52385/m.117688 type:complete len:160 (+) Transcript_52385:156-635(+)